MTRIHYQKGDIFDSKAQVIVNTVNCKGVMGKGLALAFKQRYPAMFVVYQQECRTGKLRIGRPSLYQQSTPWILNFPTKDHWKPPSKLEYLEKGLEYFVTNYKKAGIRSIAFPKLGAQNGKLSWDEVGPLMARYLSQLDIDVYIYIAEGDKEYQYDLQQECDTKESIWKQFSELALSQERLQQEVQLSSREAKKIAVVREAVEFTALRDIEHIEGLAKISLKRVKDYIAQQQFTKVEFAELPLLDCFHKQERKKSNTSPKSKRKHKRQDINVEIPTENSLFSLEELVS
ncbi:MAG: macro domain-containing protein [Chloroflexota bacterium]|nr:macro domain-containing protein [Chloroflexota bacterium]